MHLTHVHVYTICLMYYNSLISQYIPVERTFSVAGYCCIGERNRLTNQNLEREILIKTNDQYI